MPLGLLAPSLVFLALFTYWPVAEVLWDAAHAVTRRGSRFVGLENVSALLADDAFRRALLNNGLYAAGTVVPSLVLALGIALALDGAGPVKALLRAVFFLPVLIPLVAAAALFLFLFLPGIGLIDYHLAKLGLPGANWLGDPDLALGAITVLTVWKNAGYYMLFFLAGLQAIPGETREAALLDGAGPLQRLRHVTLPALRPTFAFVGVIALLNAVTQVDHVVVLTRGGPSDATKLLLFYIYEQAVERYDAGRAAAATVVTLGLLSALTAVSLRRAECSSEDPR
ncbi:carbohydrate ABC transporter permease [Methylobacterium crusticola]|uniref:carbohydrate ABC transporter permease n=1 Tax=Methylobacterium crusticola TaxID=1697972 RepID=UPI001EE2640E|nr:sugar ABC transporter permease [Methylobacterium crusticola]